jgi:hypothetical protein
MSFWAEINADTNTVIRVVASETAIRPAWAYDQENSYWLETFADGGARGNFAGVDYTYYPDEDIFMPPKTYDSWVVDPETYEWVAPYPHPSPDPESVYLYQWDEDTITWKFTEK